MKILIKISVGFVLLLLLCRCLDNAKERQIRELNAFANSRFINKNYNEAILIFNKLIKLDSPNTIKYIYQRGIAQSGLKNFDDAKKDLLLAVNENYNSKYAYQKLAQMTIAQNNDTAAALNFINMAYNLDRKDEAIIQYKLILMGREAAFQFTLDSLLDK